MAGLIDFKQLFEINAIFLSGGISSQITGGITSLMSYLQNNLLSGGVTGPADSLDLDKYFAHFSPMPGAALVNNQIGTYPFANQATAANAIITMPLNISVMMVCPVRNPGEYLRKSGIMSALKATLDNHNISGGTYVIATPSYFYTDCVMTGLRDASSGETTQSQYRWQFDFVKPLVSQQDAQQVQNSLMMKLGSGARVDVNAAGGFDFSGPQAAVGLPQSGISANAIPTTTPSLGSGTGGTDVLGVANASGGLPA